MRNPLPTRLARLLLACSLPLTSWAQSTILDPTFGTNGRVLTTFTSGNTTDQAQSVALQPDGKLVVAGYGSGGLEVARYTPAGALDATFGNGGRVSIEFGALPSTICSSASCTQEQSKALAVCVQTDGKIVLGGRRSGQWLATRLLANGQLDSSFASQGAYTLLAGTQGGEISRLGQQSSGQLILIGRTSTLNFNYPRAVRLQANGTADASFTGTVPYNNSTYSSFDGLVDNADRTVLLGYETFLFVTPTPTPQLVAYRLLPNGQLDPAFGTGGRAALPADFTGYSGGGALVPLPTGQLLVVAASSA
ncbi:delta-60 repeat domain-containing protein, partial [Hymenobacter agri]